MPAMAGHPQPGPDGGLASAGTIGARRAPPLPVLVVLLTMLLAGIILAPSAHGEAEQGALLETLTVSNTAAELVVATTRFEPLAMYQIVASGTVSDWCPSTARSAGDCSYGSPLAIGEGVDALYCYAVWRCGATPARWGQLLVDGTPLDTFAEITGQIPYTDRDNHTYRVNVTGVSGNLAFFHADGSTSDNSGAWTVQIRLVTAAPRTCDRPGACGPPVLPPAAAGTIQQDGARSVIDTGVSAEEAAYVVTTANPLERSAREAASPGPPAATGSRALGWEDLRVAGLIAAPLTTGIRRRGPPDLRLTRISLPRAVPRASGSTVPRCPTRTAARCTGDLQAAFERYVASAQYASAIEEAMALATNRRSGAYLTGNAEAIALQSCLVKTYAGALAVALDAKTDDAHTLARRLKRAGLDVRITRAQAARTARRLVRLEGIPRSVSARLAADGVDRRELTRLMGLAVAQARLGSRPLSFVSSLSRPLDTRSLRGVHASLTPDEVAATVREMSRQGIIREPLAARLASNLSLVAGAGGSGRAAAIAALTADARELAGAHGDLLRMAVAGLARP